MKIINAPSGPLMVNTYIAIDEESREGFIVDPGGFSEKTARMIDEEEARVKYIILTHGHSDHLGGVPEYKRLYPEAKLVCAKDELPMLADANANYTLEMFGRPICPEADLTVEDGDTLKVGKIELLFIMTPGHTPGGMCIYIASEGVLFSGDTLFLASIGRTDLSGGSFAAIKRSIREKLFTLPDDTQVLPGHDAYTTIGFEKKNNPFV